MSRTKDSEGAVAGVAAFEDEKKLAKLIIMYVPALALTEFLDVADNIGHANVSIVSKEVRRKLKWLE